MLNTVEDLDKISKAEIEKLLEYKKIREIEKLQNKKNKSLKNHYFKGHRCAIPPEKLESNFGPIRRFILYLTLARSSDIRTLKLYRSHAAFYTETERHAMFHQFSIHPFSRLRLMIECMSVVVICICHALNIIYITYMETVPAIHITERVFGSLFLITIISNFFTGYVTDSTSPTVVLELRKITWRYARTWLLVDLIFCSTLVAPCRKPNFVLWHNVATALKLLKLPAVFVYTFNILEVLGAGQMSKTLIEIFLIIYNYMIWNTYFQLFIEYMAVDTFAPISPRDCSWMTIMGVWNSTPTERLVFALHRSVRMFRQNSNLKIVSKPGCSYELYFILAWLIAKLLQCHCILRYLIMYIGIESARARYFMMTQQVQNYLTQRRLPNRIKKKILRFYAVRFQSRFYLESRMMACVSGQLREDIVMHSGIQLCSQMEFFKELPRPLLLQIASKLKLVVFLAGDIIFKIHTVGDCLYFIDKGTIAVYSESGKEVYHLDDGNFFGVISLVLHPCFRHYTAVAVTNCELFRMDKKDFQSSIGCYPTVYDNIKKVATQRLELITLIDEHNKAELKMGKDEEIE